MSKERATTTNSERGVALVSTILIMALLLVLALGISLTSISELGVSTAYGSQTRAFEAAEAGLNHGASLVSNFLVDTSSGAPAPMTQLLNLRCPTCATQAAQLAAIPTTLFPNSIFDPKVAAANTSGAYFYGAFSDATKFTSGCVAIPAAGLALKDANGNATGAAYRVALIDDEAFNDNATAPNPSVPNFNPPTPVNLAGWHESGDPTVDEDKRVVLYSTGTYGNTSVTLEGWVGFVPYPALLSNGDIGAGGNSSIDGTYGSVQSNSTDAGALTISGSASIAQSATAVGTVVGATSSNVGGFHAGGQPPIYMPNYVTNDPDPQIQSYLLQYTDILLIDPDFATGASALNTASDAATVRLSGLATSIGLTGQAGYTLLKNAIISPGSEQAVAINRTIPLSPTATNLTVSSTGWSYNPSNGWGLNSTPPAGLTVPSFNPTSNAYTFYVVGQDNYSSGTPNGGNIKITGNVGHPTPVELTAFATGSIELDGTPQLVSHLKALTPELPPYDKPAILFVCIEDLKCDGTLDAASQFNGIVYFGEQFDLSGNGSFNGQILGKNNTDITGSLVTGTNVNKIWGHFTLTLNTGGMIGTVKIISWRQIKE